ncbi:hypothetical protein DUI87_00487 [Hirundo rustica rustica]|uniref:Uncharacterized protein n=1 Tax=Hirundo rustica rustica TaxID=333673 RepID=A0A3M0LA88_HIRRU|nr:hypothetical protein DUI87_00487 [Hirundo rustica rustica]
MGRGGRRGLVPRPQVPRPQVSRPQELEAQVAVVAALGELAATVAGPAQAVQPLPGPESLQGALSKFIRTLRDTLDHGDVTSLRQSGCHPPGPGRGHPGGHLGRRESRGQSLAGAGDGAQSELGPADL